MRIDLNADVGESADRTVDAALFPAITSASIAAGVHAGSDTSIRAALRLAHQHRTSAGVHPSLDDRAGFGRVETTVDPPAVQRLVLDQIVTVASLAAEEGVALRHVKPHGALYNMAARDRALADAVAAAIVMFDSGLALYGPPGSALLAAARAHGLSGVAEGFADRAYAADGSLVPRGQPGAVITDAATVIARVLRMVFEQTVVAANGAVVPLPVETICLHSDTPDAPHLAAAVRSALEAARVVVRSASPH